MWPFHRESKVKLILETVAACAVVVLVVWGVHYFFKSREVGEREAAEVTFSSPEEVKANYLKTLLGLKNTLGQPGLSDAAARDKAEEVLFAARVPKEMLDKHLETVLAVRRLKDKPKIKDVMTLVDYLIIGYAPSDS